MTNNLISEMFDKLKKNPSAISSIDWLDVEVYCTACVAGRDDVYEDSDYLELSEKMHRLCHDIQYFAECDDYRSAILALAELSGIVSAMPEIDHYRSVIYQSNFDSMLLKHYKYKTSVIMGDSHVNFFSGHELLDYTPIGYDMHWCKTVNELPITALHIGAGLAYNSFKYGTTSNFREKTEYMLKNHIIPGSQILVTLGEVDCRAHVFKQTIKQSREYHEIVDDITSNYIRLLKHIKEMGFKVGCWGPIASQSDDFPIHPDEKAYPRCGSEQERNKATEYFNNRMCDLCKSSDIMFLSVFHKLIDNDYKTRNEYISSDHVHLSQSAMPLVIPLLIEAGFIAA